MIWNKINSWAKARANYAPVIVRISVSLVFLWFGVNQMLNPASFLGYLPQWLQNHSLETVHNHPLQFVHGLGLSSSLLIRGNGFVEIFLAIPLIAGFFTRVSALLLSIHLVAITIGLGYNDVAIRDFGLVMCTVSIFFRGPDKFSLDTKRSSSLAH